MMHTISHRADSPPFLSRLWLWMLRPWTGGRAKAVIPLAVLTGVLWAGAVRAGQPVTLYGDSDYPPYSYDRDGTPAGLYVQILHEAFARMPDYDLTIELAPWRRGLRMLEQGEAVGLFPPYLRPSDRPYIGAYSVPLFEESVVSYCLDAVASAVAGKPFPEGYAGLTFGNNAGFMTGGNDFEAMRRLGRIVVNESTGTELNLKKLLVGRVQCYINDRLAIRYGLRIIGSEGAGVRETAVIRKETAHVAWSREALESMPWLKALTDRLDETLRAMHEDGSINRIVNAYEG